MTPGTTSSHSRTKREQLGDILLPVPVSDDERKVCKELGEKLKKAIEEIYLGESIISEQKKYLTKLA